LPRGVRERGVKQGLVVHAFGLISSPYCFHLMQRAQNALKNITIGIKNTQRGGEIIRKTERFEFWLWVMEEMVSLGKLIQAVCV